MSRRRRAGATATVMGSDCAPPIFADSSTMIPEQGRLVVLYPNNRSGIDPLIEPPAAGPAGAGCAQTYRCLRSPSRSAESEIDQRLRMRSAKRLPLARRCRNAPESMTLVVLDRRATVVRLAPPIRRRFFSAVSAVAQLAARVSWPGAPVRTLDLTQLAPIAPRSWRSALEHRRRAGARGLVPSRYSVYPRRSRADGANAA